MMGAEDTDSGYPVTVQSTPPFHARRAGHRVIMQRKGLLRCRDEDHLHDQGLAG